MTAASREFVFEDKDFRFLSKLVYDRTGIVLAEHKRDMVYSRLARRLRALGLRDFDAYCHFLENDETGEEMGHCINAVTTNLTSFFREQHHFDHLRDQVLTPLLQDKKAQKRLRIWSAGCSSGAEPYSIAMVAHQIFSHHRDWDVKILATDIDTNMLATGRRGEYPLDYLDKIPEPYRSKYVEEGSSVTPGMFRVSPVLGEMIAFKPLNLLEAWPMKGPFDLAFCRNVVIYFDKPTQKTLFGRMAKLIKPKGWLYIGHSENLFGVCDAFKLLGKTIYTKVA